MSVHQHTSRPAGATNGGAEHPVIEGLDALAAQYGNRFLLSAAPDQRLPEHGMPAVDANGWRPSDS